MHIIICFAGKPGLHGFRQRDFYFDPALELYVWQKRRLTPEEFNKEAPQVFELNSEDFRLFAKVLFEKGDETQTGQILERDEKIKELTGRLDASVKAGEILQGEVAALKATIGTPPEGSHPDEAKPRAATWHQERLAWQGEVETNRQTIRQLTSHLARVQVDDPQAVPFPHPGNAQPEVETGT